MVIIHPFSPFRFYLPSRSTWNPLISTLVLWRSWAQSKLFLGGVFCSHPMFYEMHWLLATCTPFNNASESTSVARNCSWNGQRMRAHEQWVNVAMVLFSRAYRQFFSLDWSVWRWLLISDQKRCLVFNAVFGLLIDLWFVENVLFNALEGRHVPYGWSSVCGNTATWRFLPSGCHCAGYFPTGKFSCFWDYFSM
jgi:hypothetical protein